MKVITYLISLFMHCCTNLQYDVLKIKDVLEDELDKDNSLVWSHKIYDQKYNLSEETFLQKNLDFVVKSYLQLLLTGTYHLFMMFFRLHKRYSSHDLRYPVLFLLCIIPLASLGKKFENKNLFI